MSAARPRAGFTKSKGNIATIKVLSAVKFNDLIKKVFRPSRSMYCPRKMAPSGRMRKPISEPATVKISALSENETKYLFMINGMSADKI